MATCGKCSAINVSVAHVRACYGQGNGTTTATIEDRMAARVERNNEILHGDRNYCRGCDKGWRGLKWHSNYCAWANARRAEQAETAEVVRAATTEDKWAPVNALRNQIKPLLHQRADRAEGRYALRNDEGVVKFYRVKQVKGGRWDGKVFVDAQASDEHHPVRNPETLAQVLFTILADPHEAEVLYGQELGQCYHCGRTLTDEVSRELGIGPVCRGKL